VIKVFLAVALALAVGYPAFAPPRPEISLVVLVTVDQLRPDYFARFDRQFTGGFRTILDRGTLFDRARQNHAITETAPGHSTLLSGREPARTGIMDNERGVGDDTAPLLGGNPGPGASPRQFQGSALYDWLRAGDPEARVLSVSRKDRGAILPVGRARAPVFWWSAGRFTTSRYYADTLPAWVRAFNARGSAERFAAGRWDLLLPPSAYAEPDKVPYENGGRDVTFPHRLPASGQIAEQLQNYPWMDSLTLAFALEGARALGLGRRSKPDLLLVSLSATDAVGHHYGPDSREIHDQLLRLDRWLGWFLDSLATRVTRARTLMVLTSDHGVQSFPERVPGKGRVWLGDLVGKGRGDAFGSGLLSADTASLARRGVRVDSLAKVLAAVAARRRGVARVFTAATLASAAPNDTAATLWRNTIPTGYGWLIAGVLEPGFVWSTPDAGVAEHGSSAPLDVTVPIAFVGPGIGRATVHRPVRTVDIAPTLAALLGVRPEGSLDGVTLKEIAGSR
jgi:type I phosphodiesterase/nucleotide pyrophosphatase